MKVNKYWNKLLTVLVGSAGAQLILIALMPLLTRLVDQKEIGSYLYGLSLINIFIVLTTLRLDVAIYQELKDNVNKIINLIFFISLIFALIFTLIGIFIFNNKIFVLSISMILFSLGITNAILAKLVNDGKFSLISKYKISQSILISLFLILGIQLINDSNVIIYHAVGIFSFTLLLIYFNKISFLEKENYDFSLLKKHYKFILISTPSSFINSFSIQLPVILIAMKYGEVKLAIYALIMKVLIAPIKLIGNSILTLFKATANQEYRESGRCINAYKDTFLKLLGLSTIVFLILFFTVDYLFIGIFGKEWLEAASISKLLIPMMFFKFVAAPLTYIYFIMNKQQYDLYWQLVLLLMTLLTFYFINNFEKSVYIYSIGYSLLYIISILVTYSLSKGKKIA